MLAFKPGLAAAPLRVPDLLLSFYCVLQFGATAIGTMSSICNTCLGTQKPVVQPLQRPPGLLALDCVTGHPHCSGLLRLNSESNTGARHSLRVRKDQSSRAALQDAASLSGRCGLRLQLIHTGRELTLVSNAARPLCWCPAGALAPLLRVLLQPVPLWWRKV